MSLEEQLRKGVDTNSPPDKTDRVMYDAAELLAQCKTTIMALLLFVYPSDDWRKESVVKDAEKLIHTLDSEAPFRRAFDS